MIKNVVFDMGNVLRFFRPINFISAYQKDEAGQQAILKLLFEDGEWAKLDIGLESEAEILADWQAKAPERLHPALASIMANWHLYLSSDLRMTQLVKRLHESGYHTYLLSNAGVRIERAHDTVDAYAYMDGSVISACYRAVKPNPEIYRILFEKYSLAPQECWFIDDNADNIAGAKAVGMDGYVYTGDYDALLAAMRAKGIMIAEG